MKKRLLPPLKWIIKYYVIRSVGVASGTAAKEGGGENVNMTVNANWERTMGG